MLLATLAAVLAVAAVGYALLLDFREAAQPASDSTSRPPARAAQPAVANKPEPAARRTGQILKCPDPDGGSFYTNAPSCAEADLHNRVNVVPSLSMSRPAPQDCLGASGPQRAHHFLPQCQEVFNKALELERFLVKAEDPLLSPRAKEYCALIAEGVSAGCMATSATFCYLYLCQQLLDQE